ncbi:MAG: class I SAM-dependent methyltransferase [Chloracidobacterium sp.]|nr:class I SAM-dependent methyltransferase [Chloracidobacterium sp.]MDW8216225.1 RsmG family class I SAM-dependent methyltransferase [Acidobacteriota bacterium]
MTAHGIALDDTQVAALVTHYRLLGEANTRLNLTRLMTPEDAVRWHYLDILAALPCFTGNMPNCWVDVGSGGGFPGLVLAVARPDWRLMLAERRAKKAAFLRACVAELGLSPRVLVYAGEFEPGTARRALVSYGVDVSRETCGIVARAVEDGRRRLPQLLKLPILVRAVFWLGAADATALVECPPQGWMVEHLLPLPTGDRRTALALTRRAD